MPFGTAAPSHVQDAPQDLVLVSGTKVHSNYSKFMLLYKTHPFF